MSSLTSFRVPRYLADLIRNYFQERVRLYSSDKGDVRYNMTGGVPHGSVLGPLIWKVMYDGIFRLNLPANAEIIGFADDIAIVLVAKEFVRWCPYFE